MGVNASGLDEFDADLKAIGERAEDIRPISDEIHEEILEQSRGKRIAVDTGRLRDSIINPRSPDHVFRVTGRKVTVGSLDPAAVFNPKYVPEIDPQPIMDLLADYVVEGEGD